MRDLATGVKYFLEGQRWVARHRRWWGFGLLPGLIALVLYIAALVALGIWSDDLSAWATPFADGWDTPWRSLLRWTLTVIVFGGGLLLAMVTFTAVTLLIGEPFYEALSEHVEEIQGGAPSKPGIPLWREILTSARDSLSVLAHVVAFGVVLFACGFIPVVGQTVVPVVGFCVSGLFLTTELTGVAMQRRSVPLRTRLRLLRGRLPLALGFGVPLVLLFLVPVIAVFAMPGAVAGAALLVRELVPASVEDIDE
ncbi:EI24 domain-containing protein [Streptomyces sp. H10-C2]|uniref:EI24 domain-containing protein n=1 Tax=unclassified Streptomyces TaxID=2593676 RepID=UPI0024B9D6A9|nr:MULTISPECIES: EI24 domain-containing protein [unclassified Streptomyces]MDJ0343714.1 EI24 domain-containing protein [Streptomyces sp. PH10-H1]MDJ0372359.1 EI24 domain-containing protein [Streptomyces sp. H10-C2]